ncbi:class D sortase [Neobacillus sp. PS3-34]|uniref:class D sortase n=1 Tax=Neobacillus sp. PS3-34 TaxID=3070678 RepID=UPI0027DF5BD4|nr:class D sortase [Neobacillus sp. PS3-34]WML46801.1 class D sortase [Neobacillus sp. PS3-34]
MQKMHRKKWRWVILAIPIFVLLIGAGVVAYFGYDLTKQTVLLAHTAVKEYKPDLPDNKFDQPWPTLPEPGTKIGSLKFSSLGLNVPVVQGTHADELKKGAGHFAGSALPGQGGNVILSGHRDTVFVKLKNLKKGDPVTFTTPYGDFVYETTGFKIVHSDDMTVAVPSDHETLTLTTCYPFNFIGNAPDRFIVYTKLVSQPTIKGKS